MFLVNLHIIRFYMPGFVSNLAQKSFGNLKYERMVCGDKSWSEQAPVTSCANIKRSLYVSRGDYMIRLSKMPKLYLSGRYPRYMMTDNNLRCWCNPLAQCILF